MATELQLDVAINTANSAKSTRELSKGLKDLIALQAQIGEGTVGFKKLQDAINKTEGRIGDLNDSFSTLRGSGVERVNSSLAIFREGLLNADTEKLKIGLQGIGSAMKAIPIFLLLEGAKLLYENWGKVTEIFSTSSQQIKQNTLELEALNVEIAASKVKTDSLVISKEGELKILERQGASYAEIISKIKEINGLKVNSLNNELKGTDKELQNIISQISETKKELDNQSVTESLLGFFGFGTTDKDIKELEKKLFEVSNKRGEAVNNIAKLEIDTEETVAVKLEEQRKKEDELFKTRFARRRELEQREKDAEQQQLDDLLKMQQKHVEEVEVLQDDYFLNSIDIGKKQFAAEHAALAYSLDGRLQLIEEEKLKELALVTNNGEATLAIEKKYAELAFREKAKYLNQYADAAKVGVDVLNSYNALISQNENYDIQQRQYSKDAELENNRNRAQEQIDLETQKSNELISNEALTSEQIERIKYDTETKTRRIQSESANQELKIQQELDKASVEIRRKQFEREKKIQLVTGAINTASAILSALGTVQPFPLAVVAAAGAAVTGGLQLAAIASKKFDDGGVSARSGVEPIKNIDTRPAPSSGSSGLGSSNGPGGNTGQLLGSGLTTNSNGTIKVVVLENDIRQVSSKVDVLENRATFGN